MRRRQRRGLTLVEVLVATVFLAICAASILDNITVSLIQMDRMARRAAALLAIEDEMERMRNVARTSHPSLALVNTHVNLPGGVTATMTRSVLIGTSFTTTQNRRVSVSISWPERKISRTYTERLLVESFMKSNDR